MPNDKDWLWITAVFELGEGPLPGYSPESWPGRGPRGNFVSPLDTHEQVSPWEPVALVEGAIQGEQKLLWKAAFRPKRSGMERLAEAGAQPDMKAVGMMLIEVLGEIRDQLKGESA